MIYLTAVGYPPEGSSTVHIYTQTIQRTTQTIQRRTQKIHRKTQKLVGVRAVLRLCGFYPDICLTTEEKHGKPSVRVALHKHTIIIHSHNNNNTLLSRNKTIYTLIKK
jgi:uncharacterized protein YcfJ